MIYTDNIINDSLFIIMEESSSYNVTKREYDDFNVIDITITNGNISIDKDLFGKYENVTDLINQEINNYDGKVNVDKNIIELENVDINNLNCSKLYYLALKIFNKYNSTNIFINDYNKIIVSNGDIKENTNKIFYNQKQKKYIKEHLQVFSKLGDIIESATLSGQALEVKNRENNTIWSYYLNGLNINDELYLIEFDVISRQDGENHYRIQRLQKK